MAGPTTFARRCVTSGPATRLFIRLTLSLRTFEWVPRKGIFPRYRGDLLKLTLEEASELAAVLGFYVAAALAD